MAQLPEWLRDVIEGVDAPAQAGSSQNAVSAEDRIGRLEKQVSTLGEALLALARGLEERPDVKPDEHRVAKAARQAHEPVADCQSVNKRQRGHVSKAASLG